MAPSCDCFWYVALFQKNELRKDNLHCEKVWISPIYHQLVTNHHYPRKSQVYTGYLVYWLQLWGLSLHSKSLPNDFNWTILTKLLPTFSKSSTFISFLRLSDVTFLIFIVQNSFASMTNTMILFIFNRHVVSKPILEMVASSVTVKVTLTSFFSSESSLLTTLFSPLFSQSLFFDQGMMNEKSIYEFSPNSLHLIFRMHNLQDHCERTFVISQLTTKVLKLQASAFM